MRFIATLKRNMEKAMRHVRPPITITPIIIYRGCHMAVCRPSDDINRKTWRTSMDTISPEDTTISVCVLRGLYPYGFTSAQTPYA